MNDDKYSLGTLDLEHPKKTHDFQILLIGTGKKVLEFGPASGYVSKILKERGCYVTAIEQDKDFARKASQFVDKIIVGDAESLDLDQALGNEKYQVILLGDFLEHLKDPTSLLKKLHKFLIQDGYIVSSIPNIAYITNRLNLLNGEFNYEQTGLLDNTHLRFFTLDSILVMLNESGFEITQLHRVKEDFFLPHRTDFKSFVIPEELVESILKDPDSTTFQYVFKAIPKTASNAENRRWSSEFSKNYVTERLKEILQYYKDFPVLLQKKNYQNEVEIQNLQQELLDVIKKLQMTSKEEYTRLYERVIELETILCYKEELGRNPDDVGFQFYVNKIRNGEMTVDEMRQSVKNSEEALSRKQENE